MFFLIYLASFIVLFAIAMLLIKLCCRLFESTGFNDQMSDEWRHFNLGDRQ